MAKFSVNARREIAREIPYRNFKFLVRWDMQVVAAVSKVSALKRTTEVVSHREGGDDSTPRLAPGLSKYEPVTLERGITFAPEFAAWANLVFQANQGDGAVSLAGFRKNIRIELLNLQGTVVRAYDIFRCWPSEFTSLPELDANANAIAFEMLVLQNEGFVQDPSVVEQAET